MATIRWIISLPTLLLLASVAAAEQPIDFNRDIRPLLSGNCFHCHGPDAETREGGLRLDQREGATSESESGEIAIVPGKPERWKAVLPTLKQPGESFRLGLKAEDIWGNPSDQIDGTFRLAADRPVQGLPETVTFSPGEQAKITRIRLEKLLS